MAFAGFEPRRSSSPLGVPRFFFGVASFSSSQRPPRTWTAAASIGPQPPVTLHTTSRPPAMSVSSSGCDASLSESSFYDTDSSPTGSRSTSPTLCGHSRRSSSSSGSDTYPRSSRQHFGLPKWHPSDSPFFVEKWDALSSKLLDNELYSVLWEARYRRTFVRTNATDAICSVEFQSQISASKICAHAFLCAQPPAGKQHLVDSTLVACCSQHPRRPFDPGKYLC